MSVATFAAGCFWGVEQRFKQTEGVTATTVGYMGGHTKNPTYHEVCTGTTGHAEVVQVEFDPEKINYQRLLQIFFDTHNPTQLNRQGMDIGNQYRSVIFYYDETQQKLATAAKQALDLSGRYSSPVVTEIRPANTFYRAEEYHQCYLEKRGGY